MKKVELKKTGSGLSLDRRIVANLNKSQMANVVGGLTSIISCHTYHAGSRCSGCQTCCSGGGCFAPCQGEGEGEVAE
ncbi:class I lanthipeptide [Chitinophaga nivalis]|uniref:Class I lanthipeptide n=1 Tax=Chitinophaga nivalis TaxID=2991709 RepID=A0ABT3IHA9_9BACT|nr:class I lanthipeptide [Chitinophaga nivalis]MCW3466968.1 class I lanthipeptide [Chitinophaga nivalis]MCW3483341.1 class I lanthipeptide [Chitinophaga nivalis]